MLADGILYAATRNSFTHTSAVYAVNARTHRLLWKHPLTGFIYGGLLVAGGHVFVPWSVSDMPSPTGALIALAASDGQQEWRTPLPGDPSSPPIISGDKVYLSVDGGWVMALSPVASAVVWRVQPANYLVGVSPITAWHGLIYITAGRTFFRARYRHWRPQVEAHG